MLIELLKNIFGDKGYIEHTVEFREYTSYIYSHQEKEEYFIVLDKETIIDDDLNALISEGMQNLYDYCKNLNVTSETFEKNTTLLICINNTAIDSDILNEIEEDTYLFKKNILTYQDDHLSELTQQLNDDFSLTKLNELLNNGEAFEQNKENNNSTYELLTKIFIKLPFLSYKRENRVMENLSDIIREEANNKDLYSLYLQISNEMINTDGLNSYENIIHANLLKGDENE